MRYHTCTQTVEGRTVFCLSRICNTNLQTIRMIEKEKKPQNSTILILSSNFLDKLQSRAVYRVLPWAFHMTQGSLDQRWVHCSHKPQVLYNMLTISTSVFPRPRRLHITRLEVALLSLFSRRWLITPNALTWEALSNKFNCSYAVGKDLIRTKCD